MTGTEEGSITCITNRIGWDNSLAADRRRPDAL
jgi:hypothetical protein